MDKGMIKPSTPVWYALIPGENGEIVQGKGMRVPRSENFLSLQNSLTVRVSYNCSETRC